jgi:hypothetical protein
MKTNNTATPHHKKLHRFIHRFIHRFMQLWIYIEAMWSECISNRLNFVFCWSNPAPSYVDLRRMQSTDSDVVDPGMAVYAGRFKRKMSAPTVTRHRQCNDGLVEWVSDDQLNYSYFVTWFSLTNQLRVLLIVLLRSVDTFHHWSGAGGHPAFLCLLP